MVTGGVAVTLRTLRFKVTLATVVGTRVACQQVDDLIVPSHYYNKITIEM